MRAFAAIPVVIAVCLATPAFAAGRNHVSAARKAERKGQWRKALQEWKAAYAREANAEYLIGIGDAYSHLGNKTEARKSYEAYLGDPLALPANLEKVKGKIARLASPADGALALPLPRAGPAALPPLPGTAVAAAGKNKKVEPPLPLPGLELPAAPPSRAAASDKAVPPPLPGLDLPAATAPAKKEPEKVISSAPALPPPGVPTRVEPPPSKSARPIVSVPEKAPLAAVTAAVLPREPHRSSSGAQRAMAYVTAGVAIAALGGGAFAFTQANSAHSELTNNVHSGAEAQRLLEDERRNKTLSFVGLAGGVVAAGIATALFAF
jgi:hypothetical protein